MQREVARLARDGGIASNVIAKYCLQYCGNLYQQCHSAVYILRKQSVAWESLSIQKTVPVQGKVSCQWQDGRVVKTINKHKIDCVDTSKT